MDDEQRRNEGINQRRKQAYSIAGALKGTKLPELSCATDNNSRAIGKIEFQCYMLFEGLPNDRCTTHSN